eukprot:CAMPEP_0119315260 /NCGR_PEP_ID=MMETSP1333-20130426/35051_1 /TAXON_ID=418940 /ORGANISM="Scyphosphaera apsteinii, Strain RCC1455" /LENGTH=290 /DNA_ID=CAMNT_0007320559 /DNA_START=160 /DNA_END=1032 /DNA_ORIENTATION=+
MMSHDMFASQVTAHALRLQPGDDLGDALINYCSKLNVSSATVLSCVGSLSEMRLRLAGAAYFLELKEPLEIVSLVGTICSDRNHHLHCAVARADGSVVGGHVKGPAVIATTAEVVLGHLNGIRFRRELDDVTGYLELQISHAEVADKQYDSKSGREQLEHTVRGLRVPVEQGGCPWTGEQSVQSMIGCMREELVELNDALEAHAHGVESALEEVKTELGDVLFNAEMMVQLASRDLGPDVDPGCVFSAAARKIKRRTPYMRWTQENACRIATVTREEAMAQWKDAKASES